MNKRYNVKTGLENYLLWLQDKGSQFEYVSGYVNDDSKVKLKCKNCGDIIERYSSGIRHSPYICCNCIRVNKQRNKDIEKFKRQRAKELKKLEDSVQLSFFICKHCGNLFIPMQPNQTVFCSKRCRNRNRENQKSRQRVERARANGDFDYDITLDKLIKRDNNICYICGKECNLNDFVISNNTKICGDYYPSIDHVVALARGGTHTWGNIRLAHRICNSLKSAN